MASVPPVPAPDRATPDLVPARSGNGELEEDDDELEALEAPDDLDLDGIGGMLSMGAGDELALGGAEDYGVDVAALGEDDGEPVFGLSFGSAHERGDGTGAWELADLAELVVQETGGKFDATSDARHDVSVMEEEFDPDDDVVRAVWAPTLPGAPMRVSARVKRKRPPALVSREYLPYGVIAGGLAGLLAVVVVGVLGVVLFGLLAGPSRVVAPLDPVRVPKVEIERKPIEPQTAEEILEEVLGEDGEGAKE